MKKSLSNKWTRAAIPALLLHCSIGTVYCWSMFSQEIVDYFLAGGKTVTKGTVEWAFSLAIFFLGMSAAFLGKIVEKDIHRSSLIATICFVAGMAGTGFFISQRSIVGIYLCYGLLMGIGLGTGYLSPVKTLMLWFQDRKGLATGLAVAGFGAAKAIASPIMQYLLGKVGIVAMFYILAGAYFVMMFTGHLLLKKPEGWVETPAKKETGAIAEIKKQPVLFIGIWLMFYINITCGLALISQEKMIVKCIGLAAFAGVLSSVTAIFNAGGRLGFSAWADAFKDRNTIYKIIFILSIIATGLVIVTNGIPNKIIPLVFFLLCVANAGYGGGFSNVPTLLADNFGMHSISAIHGIVLSAWAIAGLTGNQLATYIVNHTGEWVGEGDHKFNPIGYQHVLYVTIVLYMVALAISFFLVRGKKREDMA